MIAPSVQRILVDLGAGRQIVGMPRGAGTERPRRRELRDLAPRPDRRLLDDRRPADRAGRARRAEGASSTRRPTTRSAASRGRSPQLGLITGRPGGRLAARPRDRGRSAQASWPGASLARVPGVSVFVDTGSLHDRVRPVAGGRHAPGGARPERRRRRRRRSAVDPRSSPGSTRDWYLATSDSGTTLAAAAQEPEDAQAPRRSAPGTSRSWTRDLLDPGPTIGDGLLAARTPAPSGCVSLSSTPSPSTATGRCCTSTDPAPGASPRARRRTASSAPEDAVAAAFAGRGRALPTARAHGAATPRAWPRSGATASRVFLDDARRPARAGRIRRRVHRRARLRAGAGRGRDARPAARARAPPGRRRELGLRAPRAPRAAGLLGLLRHRRHVGAGGRGQARPGHLPRSRSRELGVDAGPGPARRRRAARRGRRARRRDSRFAPAPLATAFDGLGVSGRLVAWLALDRRADRARLRARAPRRESRTGTPSTTGARSCRRLVFYGIFLGDRPRDQPRRDAEPAGAAADRARGQERSGSAGTRDHRRDRPRGRARSAAPRRTASRA